MEIHAPERPVHSARDAITHLVLITAGVLIALSFEGVATWREHRALVREARANLTSEIRDNRKELAGLFDGLAAGRQQLNHALVVAQMALDRKPIEDGSVEIGLALASLQNASRTTAEVTGALGLMDYDEVKKYASVYGHQEQFIRLQNDTFQNLTRALAIADILAHPSNATAREIENCKESIRLTLASLVVEEQLGRALLNEYD